MKTRFFSTLKSALTVIVLTAAFPVLAQSQYGMRSRANNYGQGSQVQVPVVVKPQTRIDFEKQVQSKANEEPTLPLKETMTLQIKRALESKKSRELQKSQQRPQGGTGVDGGGGDIPPDAYPELTPKTLESYIKYQAVKTLRYIFLSIGEGDYKHVLWAKEHKQYRETLVQNHNKLYSGVDGKTIFTALKTAAVLVQLEPCIDPVTGEQKDASANVSQNSICVSFNRVAEKAHPSDLDSALIPLLAHDYGHLLIPNDEEQGKAIEEFIKKKDLELEGLSQRVENFETETEYLGAEALVPWLTLNEMAAKGDDNKICLKALEFNKITDGLLSAQMKVWQLPMLSDEKQYLWELLRLRMQNLSFICQQTALKSAIEDLLQSSEDEAWRSDFWKSKETQISAYEAIQRRARYHSEHFGEVDRWQEALKNEGVFERMHIRNRRALKNELTRIKQLFKKLDQETGLFEFWKRVP